MYIILFIFYYVPIYHQIVYTYALLYWYVCTKIYVFGYNIFSMCIVSVQKVTPTSPQNNNYTNESAPTHKSNNSGQVCTNIYFCVVSIMFIDFDRCFMWLNLFVILKKICIAFFVFKWFFFENIYCLCICTNRVLICLNNMRLLGHHCIWVQK